MDETERKKDSGNQRQGESTKERGGTTVEAKDRENGLKKEKEQQQKPKNEIMCETKGMKDSGNQRQKEWTKERLRTTVEDKDREIELKKYKERQWKPTTEEIDAKQKRKNDIGRK